MSEGGREAGLQGGSESFVCSASNADPHLLLNADTNPTNAHQQSQGSGDVYVQSSNPAPIVLSTPAHLALNDRECLPLSLLFYVLTPHDGLLLDCVHIAS